MFVNKLEKEVDVVRFSFSYFFLVLFPSRNKEGISNRRHRWQRHHTFVSESLLIIVVESECRMDKPETHT